MAIHQNLLSLLRRCFTGYHFPSFPAVMCDAGTQFYPVEGKWRGRASQTRPFKGSFRCCSVLSPSPRHRVKLGSHTAPPNDCKKQSLPLLTLQHAPSLWTMDVNSADRWATRLGPCSEIAKHLIKLSLLVTSKANGGPTEPAVLKE